ncbi:MAG: hypothetical protein QOF62_1707 [Pyrinomonadaceae bacterium]|jgi:hypothetical protein|nr:hypothetical protein [Pyrinomonadaceae bacterium]
MAGSLISSPRRPVNPPGTYPDKRWQSWDNDVRDPQRATDGTPTETEK